MFGALEPGDRAGQDDRAAARRLQVRDRDLGGEPHPGEVDVDHVPPGLLAHLLGRAAASRCRRSPPTMSSRPSSATPVVDRGLERVVVAHVGLAGDDPPVERLDLLDRLGEVARRRPSGRGTVSIWRQMSTAMMSAPSCASRTAWLRPWPRAAPVMKATLPETRPISASFVAGKGMRSFGSLGFAVRLGSPPAGRRDLCGSARDGELCGIVRIGRGISTACCRRPRSACAR